MPDGGRIVYSTEPGFKLCPQCGQWPCACVSADAKQAEPVKISFKRTGKGAGITLIENIKHCPQVKEDLLKRFKKRLGAGGTIKNGALEIQGDRRDFLASELAALGYKIKKL